ncbi:MAG: hypothetical protein Q4C40_00135 [Eubacteriales bacterium]|nr:hypothetical protein [Eubacteriales bacterium]
MKKYIKHSLVVCISWLCVCVLSFTIFVMVDFVWSQKNIVSFEADEIERGIPAWLMECNYSGEETFIGEYTEDITCHIVLIENNVALVEVTTRMDGEIGVSRRVLRKQAITGKYQLAYRPIEDREIYMDIYPENGIVYTGSTFAYYYQYTVDLDTNTILEYDHKWTMRMIQIIFLWVLCIVVYLLYQRKQIQG